jgi:hypothetical protein
MLITPDRPNKLTMHTFVQNIRRGHYELGTEETVNLRV